MARLRFYFRKYLRRFAWGFLMLALTNAAAMSIPQLFRMAVDGIEADAPTAELQRIALAMLGVAVAGALFRVLSRVHIFYAGRDVEQDIRDSLYQHLTQQPPAFFARHPTGDLMSRATYDLTQVRLLLGPGLLNLVNTAMIYLVAIPLMLVISPKLTAVSLGIYAPALFIMQRLARRLYVRNRTQQEQMGKMGNFVQENLAGAHVVRTFGMEQAQAERFNEINQSYYKAAVDLAWMRSTLWPLMAAFASVGVLGALYLGALDVMEQRLTLGQLVAVVEYLAILAWPSFAVGWVISMVQRGMAAMERINAILDEEPAIISGEHQPESLRPSLEVRDLTLELDGRKVLDGVSFSLPAGHTLGVVGPIGAGKSVLVHALVRQLEVQPGHVLVDGHDVTSLDLAHLRAVFGFVHQTPLLFSKTVAENVSFGRPGASRSEVLQALQVACFADDLAALPQGLDTPVGERGITLSGGQKQRTAIARALLLNPPILVLDDALSSVDAETESKILSALESLRRGKTNVIVAHRVSAVQHAHEIIVMDQGRVIQRGDHASLLAQEGLYRQMCQRQQLERALEAQGGRRESA